VVALDQREPSDKILEQFGRQILVPGVDEDGQLQLTQRKICIIGIGALGTIASQYLVRSGIGDIHLIDPDVIEESNLHRQINYTLDDVGKYKSEVSKKILTNINDITSLKSYPVSFEKYLEKESIDHFDLVMDCTDSHQNKIFSSKYCKKKFIPFVSISINSSDGIYFSQNYKYNNKTSSCFECLFPQTEQNHRCLNSAMIGPVAGFVTSLACTKIIFALANQNLKLKNEINLIDLLTSDINKLQLKKISCPH
jgi:molybdopterin/thiamine biosynthesis adenylyltransferase